MDAKALPIELLDERELHERYRSIDMAASHVRDAIKEKLKAKKLNAVPAKLKIAVQAVEPA